MWRALFGVALAALAFGSAFAQPAALRLPDGVVPTAYDLSFSIDPRDKRFLGEARITLTLATATQEITLHGKGLRVTKATLTPDGGTSIAATYREDERNPGWARLSLASAAPPGKALLTIAYDAPYGERESGLYRTRSDDATMYAFSQMEPIAARRVFPSFDEPRFKTSYTVAVTARAGDVVVANAPLVRKEAAGDKVRHVFATTEPLPTYLVALAVGPFEVVEAKPLPKTARRAREVPLRGIARKGYAGGFTQALATTRVLVEWFEDYFAAPYPYAKLDLIAVPGKPGAMENAGAITYGEGYIFVDRYAPLSAQRQFAEIHAHELSHQWFGNLVTPMWWDDVWLNESFATWISHRAAGAVMPEKGLGRMLRSVTSAALARDALRGAKPIRRPILTERDIDGAFDFITYYKGAAVIAMIEDRVGRDRFRDALRAHIARRAPFGNTTSKEFFASLEQAIGDRTILPAFESFIDQPHAPVLTGAASCEGAPRQAVAQATYAPLGWSLPDQRWTIPLCTKSLGGTGEPARACTTLTERQTELPVKSCPKVVVLNGGPGYFHQAYDAAGWKALAAQWSALTPDEQTVALEGARTAFAANALPPPALLDFIAKSAATTDNRLLTGAVNQVQALETTVPDTTLEAYRAWVRATLSSPLANATKPGIEPELADSLLRTMATVGREPGLRARLAQSGRAALSPIQLPISSPTRDLALRVAVEDGGPEIFAAVLKQAQASDNMLFRIEALRALGHTSRSDDRATLTAALKGFHPVEVILALFEWSAGPTTAPFAWDVAKQQFENLAARQPEIVAPYPVFARGLCTVEGRADLAAFVASKKEKFRFDEDTLSQSVDAVDHCTALRAAQGAPLGEALTARASQAALRPTVSTETAFEAAFLERDASQATGFGEIVAACGRKFPSSSLLVICTEAPEACRDARRLLQQCLGN